MPPPASRSPRALPRRCSSRRPTLELGHAGPALVALLSVAAATPRRLVRSDLATNARAPEGEARDLAAAPSEPFALLAGKHVLTVSVRHRVACRVAPVDA